LKEQEEMKSTRMFSILNLLVNHQKMTAQELVESLMCRNELFIAILKHLAGIPIVSYPGQGGGF